MVAGMGAEEVSPLLYRPAASPHLAAELSGERIDPERLLGDARAAAAAAAAVGGALVVEGVGGLLVPLAEGYSVCDLAKALRLGCDRRPPGSRDDQPQPADAPGGPQRGPGRARDRAHPLAGATDGDRALNRETIERLGEVEVQALAAVGGPDPAELARAGQALPWKVLAGGRASILTTTNPEWPTDQIGLAPSRGHDRRRHRARDHPRR